MSKQSFLSRIGKVEKDALKYIRDVLQKRGTGYELIDPATFEDGFEDEVYELPRGINVTKHGFYEEFPIVVINIDDKDNLIFEGLAGINETDEDRKFTENDLSTPCICHIADIIADLEK